MQPYVTVDPVASSNLTQTPEITGNDLLLARGYNEESSTGVPVPSASPRVHSDAMISQAPSKPSIGFALQEVEDVQSVRHSDAEDPEISSAGIMSTKPRKSSRSHSMDDNRGGDTKQSENILELQRTASPASMTHSSLLSSIPSMNPSLPDQTITPAVLEVTASASAPHTQDAGEDMGPVSCNRLSQRSDVEDITDRPRSPGSLPIRLAPVPPRSELSVVPVPIHPSQIALRYEPVTLSQHPGQESRDIGRSRPPFNYAQGLFGCGFGLPLWRPEPIPMDGRSRSPREVHIGDVGLIREGQFVPLFNAMRRENDPLNKHGVPAHFFPLRVHSSSFTARHLAPGVMYSPSTYVAVGDDNWMCVSPSNYLVSR